MASGDVKYRITGPSCQIEIAAIGAAVRPAVDTTGSSYGTLLPSPSSLMSLEIVIINPASTSNRTLTFSNSPVRIGRNQLNDISLDDPFVSEWHGVIRFSDESIAYFDLGSTNGSVVEGVRLTKNVPVPLAEKSRILLGRIEISISRHLNEPRKTMAWGHIEDPTLGPSQRGGVAFGADHKVRQGEAPSRRPVEEPSWKPTGASSHFGNVADAGASLRQEKILEAFCEAFVGLRKGYEQFGAEVGVRTINGRTPFHRARTGKEILDHLLQPSVDVGVVTRELIAVFADFGIHHIAMMEAVTSGARALLQSFDPRANDLDVGGRLFSATKSKTQWKSYLERFDQALTDDQDLHASLFGAEFARAYAEVALGDGTDSGEADED